jgi:hypothetical protein
MAKRKRHFPYIQSVLVGWDNTPRRGRDAIVVVKSTPESFERALAAAMDAARLDGQEDPIVFINGWNEWAEGNHLEPGQQYGLEFLKRVQGLSLG